MMTEAGTYDNRAYLTVLMVQLIVVVCRVSRICLYDLQDCRLIHSLFIMFNGQEIDIPLSVQALLVITLMTKL